MKIKAIFIGHNFAYWVGRLVLENETSDCYCRDCYLNIQTNCPSFKSIIWNMMDWGGIKWEAQLWASNQQKLLEDYVGYSHELQWNNWKLFWVKLRAILVVSYIFWVNSLYVRFLKLAVRLKILDNFFTSTCRILSKLSLYNRRNNMKLCNILV